MKQLFYLLLLPFIVCTAKAQLVPKAACGVFTVDILDGKLNGLKPNARWEEIKQKLPCFTASEPEGAAAKCGGTVFYKDRDVYFFTDRDYIEIGEHFKGKLTVPVMGASRNSLFSVLGNPKLKDESWDAYEMAYGTLVLHYNKVNKVNLVQFTTRSADMLSLCDQPH
ncbi:MAG: hypothetical protein ABI813_01985 [Bacteroidota bacterium]